MQGTAINILRIILQFISNIIISFNFYNDGVNRINGAVTINKDWRQYLTQDIIQQSGVNRFGWLNFGSNYTQTDIPPVYKANTGALYWQMISNNRFVVHFWNYGNIISDECRTRNNALLSEWTKAGTYLSGNNWLWSDWKEITPFIPNCTLNNSSNLTKDGCSLYFRNDREGSTVGGTFIGINYFLHDGDDSSYGNQYPTAPFSGIGCMRGNQLLFISAAMSVRPWRTNEGSHTGYVYSGEPVWFNTGGKVGSYRGNESFPMALVFNFLDGASYGLKMNGIEYNAGLYLLKAARKNYDLEEEIPNNMITVTKLA